MGHSRISPTWALKTAFVATLGALMVGLLLFAVSARADSQPSLSVKVNSDGSLTANWTKASDQDSYEFLYDTNKPNGMNGQQTPIGTASPCSPGSSVSCCPRGYWCYPGNGDPLQCYHTYYDGETPSWSCEGHQDVANQTQTVTTAPLQQGFTYYVQVLVYNSCYSSDAGCGSNRDQAAYWSNVVPIVDKPSPPCVPPNANGESSFRFTRLNTEFQARIKSLYALFDQQGVCYQFVSGFRTPQEQKALRTRWHAIADQACRPSTRVTFTQVNEKLKARGFAQKAKGCEKNHTAKGGPGLTSKHTAGLAADISATFPPKNRKNLSAYRADTQKVDLCGPPTSDYGHLEMPDPKTKCSKFSTS